MAEQPENLVIELLRAIRTEVGELHAKQAETNLKIETLAGSMVSMRKDINGLGTGMNSLEATVQGLRFDVRMIAIAVDGHAQRLDKIEAHLALAH